ncbi:MAG TPA: nuclear transport factor 2 family protein [Stellaceae bacterium]|nr:nuclear transport factor 2 family protein [Stellaceae bacterium]
MKTGLMIRFALVGAALLLSSINGIAAPSGTDQQLLGLYARFAEAQNARDLDRLRPLLSDGPQFLWVSDGQSFWGREAALARMANFQAAEVWHNTPDLEHAVAVPLNPDAAYLHLPVELAIGPADRPGTFRFLVSMLCVRSGNEWRIAALFTTTQKSP